MEPTSLQIVGYDFAAVGDQLVVEIEALVLEREVLVTAGRVSAPEGHVGAQREQRRAPGGAPVLADDVERVLEHRRVPQPPAVTAEADVGDRVALGILPTLDVLADHAGVPAP